MINITDIRAADKAFDLAYSGDEYDVEHSMAQLFATHRLDETYKLRKALERSMLAIDDWLNTYAHDVCAPGDVAAARERIHIGGGTLHYIATVQQQNREALCP